MKKYILSILMIVSAAAAYSQTAWIEPENPDVTKPIRIYVNLDKTTDQSLAPKPDPYYIWTWSPVELPAGDSLANGEGERPWQNSNERLKMTKDDTKGARVYYYEMTPTLYYRCSANDVYTKGISLLVKTKNGGGYENPENYKTEDLVLTVSPPKLDRGIIYSVPKIMYEDAITSVVYDNPLETKASMKNLADGDVYMHLSASVKDTATQVITTVQPTTFFLVHTNPKLRMKKMADGRFKLTMVPRQFFNIPAGSTLVEVTATVRRQTFNTSNDQTDAKPKLKYGCQ